MRLLIPICAAMMLFGSAAFAQGQPSSDAKVDPVRLQLARDILDANGGAKAVEVRLRTMFGSMSDLMKANLGDKGAEFAEPMMKYMIDEQVKALPQLLDSTAEAYARHLTETELRDMLAWNRSASAQGIRDKMPAILQDMMAQQAPLMSKMVRNMVKASVDRACDEKHCTPAQRQELGEIANKALPPSAR